MNDIMTIRGGDVSCVYFTAKGGWDVYISRYGEMGHYFFTDANEMEDYLRTAYYFDDDLIEEFKTIIQVY